MPEASDPSTRRLYIVDMRTGTILHVQLVEAGIPVRVILDGLSTEVGLVEPHAPERTIPQAAYMPFVILPGSLVPAPEKPIQDIMKLAEEADERIREQVRQMLCNAGKHSDMQSYNANLTYGILGPRNNGETK